MSRDRRRSLRFESLESKQLLSTVPATTPLPAAAVSPLPLDGTMTAGAFSNTRVTGASSVARIALAGNAGAMGNVVGLLNEGINTTLQVAARAKLTITNADGSVTLTLTHFVVMRNLTKPWNMGFLANYKITSGTGAFLHAQGTGTFDIEPDIGDLDMHLALHSS
jgi:hypothetical protein